MFYTIIFGMMPLAIRVLLSTAAPSSTPIPWFSLSDFAFFGIMVNVATISGVSTNKMVKPNVLAVFVAISVLFIMAYVAIHTIAMLPSSNLQWPTAIAVLLLIISFLVSLSSTDTDTLQWLQIALDNADWIDSLGPTYEREYVVGFVKRSVDGNLFDVEIERKMRDEAIENDQTKRDLESGDAVEKMIGRAVLDKMKKH